MKTDIKVLNNRVLIQIQEMEKKSEGGIIFIDAKEEDPEYIYGEVKAVGQSGKTEIPVTDGNKVLVPFKNSGTKIKLDGYDCIIVNFSEILAVMG